MLGSTLEIIMRVSGHLARAVMKMMVCYFFILNFNLNIYFSIVVALDVT